MKQFPLSKAFLIAIPALMLFACTCNTPTPIPENPDPTIVSGTCQLSGNYHILSVRAVEFSKLLPFPGGKRRGALFLKYQIDSDKLTMAGWQFGKFKTPPIDTFGQQPDIVLSSAGTSTIAYSIGSYLGDIVISNLNVKDIKTAITDPNSEYIVFTPKIIGTGNNNVAYSISISNSPSGKELDFIKGENGQTFKSTTFPFDGIPIPPGGGNVLDDN